MYKTIFGKVVRSGLILFLGVISLASCGDGSSGDASGRRTAANNAPTASNVSITDDNAGNAEVGDSLTGSYTYTDAEGDAEGTSTFRWLRNGTAISGATASTYILVAADSGQLISFEITPVAVTGTSTGDTVSSARITVTNNTAANSAPTANNVNITDDNAGSALVDDDLTGSYTYADADGDAEGTSTFRWLRNGAAISGAIASGYTLVAADIPGIITFEVTPVAASGDTNGSAVTSAGLQTGVTPFVAGFARYLDINKNGINDTGDQVIVPFDQDVSTNAASDSDFDLPVSGNSFGTGATVTNGPASNEVTVTLGATASLKTRQDFAATVTSANSASGVDVSALMTTNAIENSTGVDAVSSIPIDLIPAYVDSLQALGSYVSEAIALGDVDGDGDLDMVVVNYEYNNLVYTNNAGTFTDSGQLLGTANSVIGFGSQGTAVAMGDINGDGALDIVVGNKFASGVYTNDGSGAFTDSGQSLGGTDAIALGDVDGDGDLDVVLGNAEQFIYSNDGSGVFTNTQTLPSPVAFPGANSFSLGDINGDGALDIVAGGDGGNPIYINDGSGNFAYSGSPLSSPDDVRSHVVLGDVNGDGSLDAIVVANGNGSALTNRRLYFNDGAGNFSNSGQVMGSPQTHHVLLRDIDDDGDLDMLVIAEQTTNEMYINDGNGVFTDSGQALGVNSLSVFGGYNSHAAALGDVDGDGDIDMVVANRAPGLSGGGDVNRVYLNSLSGTWGSVTYVDSGQSLDANSSHSAALGDVDNDGDLDMVVANTDAGNWIYRNDGAGDYSNAIQLVDINNSHFIALSDVDSDGDLDMVVANGGTEANQIYSNNGSGTFTDSGQTLGANFSEAIAMGDIDGDGDMDMVVANGQDGGINQANRIYINAGGIFTDSGQLLGLNESQSIALGDVDGNGTLDMVVANLGDGNRVYTNNGSGIFTDSTQSLGTNTSRAVALSDVDDDGDLDMVVANFGEANRVYTNNGSGVFTDSGQTLGTNDSRSVAMGDVDGDGDPDIAIANSSGQGNRYYLNNGSGVFTDAGQSLGTNSSRAILLGDVDKDGDLDMVSANTSNQADRVYLNQ